MVKVTNGFIKKPMPQFGQFLESVVARMTGNTNYPNQQTDVQAISTKADQYYDLAEKAINRDKVAVAKRNACRQQICNDLNLLGLQVSAVANGNIEMLASSGFPYSQPRKPFPPMSKPKTPILSLGVNDGELLCKAFSQPGLKSVNYYITADETALKATDNAGWNIISYNKVKYTFSGLVSGQRYYVRVGFVGVRGQEVFSDYVSYIPQ